MIKAILFDLDGVLVDAKDVHYQALNNALETVSPGITISYQDHLTKFDGLKTNEKLKILSDEYGLDASKHKEIWELKQNITRMLFQSLPTSNNIRDCIYQLYLDGYVIACCSNSIRQTVTTILEKLNVLDYMSLVLSNEDVTRGKPSPEIYWTAMIKLNIMPEETLIIEDSPTGLLAATRSGANIMRVKNTADVSYANITNTINKLKGNSTMSIPKWKDDKLNIVIPMAGAGSRFETAGYTFPKPLIEVNGKPMIQLIVENLNIDANYIFVVRREHREKYNLDTLLNLIAPNCTLVEVDGITDGAARTVLLTEQYINSDAPLIIANSDQFIQWDSNEFMYKMNETKVDAGIITFYSTHPKWSFIKTDESGYVTEVAEKNPISDMATAGIYYWKHGSDFVKYANQMISKDIRVNNEFYVCPVFNEAILDGKLIIPHFIDKMWGLGTPEDLNVYLSNYQ